MLLLSDQLAMELADDKGGGLSSTSIARLVALLPSEQIAALVNNVLAISSLRTAHADIESLLPQRQRTITEQTQKPDAGTAAEAATAKGQKQQLGLDTNTGTPPGTTPPSVDPKCKTQPQIPSYLASKRCIVSTGTCGVE